ncbi:MAG: DUF4328 domain-containing protein [Planctomycetota bacterium]
MSPSRPPARAVDTYGRPRDERPILSAYLAAAVGILGVGLEVVAYLPFLRRVGPWPEDVVAPGFLGGEIEMAFIALVAFFGWHLSRWVRRVETDAPAWRYSVDWAAASWLVPGLNLVMPFLVLREVWSHLVGSGSAGRAPLRLSAWVFAWASGHLLLIAAWIATEFVAGVDDAVLGGLRLGSLGLRAAAALLIALTLHALATVEVAGGDGSRKETRHVR